MEKKATYKNQKNLGDDMRKNTLNAKKLILILIISSIFLFLMSCNSNEDTLSNNEEGNFPDVDLNLGLSENQNNELDQSPDIEENDLDKEEEEKGDEGVFYYISEFEDRYEAYQSLHPDLKREKVILDVNMSLDYDFYDHIKAADRQDGLLILCNKYSQLAEDFQPLELEDVPSRHHLQDGKTYKLNKQALEDFIAMSQAAKEDGIDLTIVSAYRTHSYQAGLYDRYKNKHGKDQADTFSARPGHSEHETGLAIDINQISNSFKNTKAYDWLQDNAKDFGYILRYKEDQSHRTGYMYEPWHYRYVGVEVARFIESEDLLFDEYYAMYVLPSKYKQDGL